MSKMRVGFRAKLIISYAAVIFLTLMLAIGLFWLVVQQIQRSEQNDAKTRLANLTQSIAATIVGLSGSANRSPAVYQRDLNFFAQALSVRILLIDAQHDVEADTGASSSQNIQGQKLNNYSLIPRDSKAYPGNFTLGGVSYIYYARPGPCILLAAPTFPSTLSNLLTDFKQPRAAASSLNQANQSCNSLGNNVIDSDLLLAVPESSLYTTWNVFLLGVVLAALTALVVAIIVAFFIARSIALPLVRMTRASEAIAKGDYNQRLKVSAKDRDEIGRLGQSFNYMVQEVSRNQQTMRDFVANVSHELKTPLTSIQGFSQAIVDGTADNSALLQHSAEVIHTEAARMRRLVDELLDLSRIESGQVELNWRDIDLTYLLGRVLSRLQPLASEKQISLHAQIQPDLFSHNVAPRLLVQGDGDRLEQIFTNLIDNAIKYSPGGGDVYVKLSLTSNADVGSKAGTRETWVAVSIRNNGPLIPADEMPRIFERFYKLDKSRVRKRGDSTGLGLAIVRELIEAHHGQIKVESIPTGQNNQGSVSDYDYAADSTADSAIANVTTFTVYLPLLRQVSPAQSSPASSSNFSA